MGKNVSRKARARRALALEMHNQFYSQAEIARELRISQSGVSKLLRRAEAAQQEEMAATIAAAPARMTRQLEYIARRAMAAWEDAARPARKVQLRKKGDGEVIQTTEETRDQKRDASLLNAARGALAQIGDVWRIGAKETQPKPLTEKEKNLQELDKFKARHATTEEIRAIEERQTREGFPPFPYPEPGKPLPEFPVIPPGWPGEPSPPADPPLPSDPPATS